MIKLAWYKALAELQVEAARRYLGIIWWIAEPLLYMATFYAVFAVGLRLGGEDYVPFLLCGLVPWKWFATTVQGASTLLAENKGLMNQVYFPKNMLVTMLLMVNEIKALIIFGILTIGILAFGFSPDWTWLHLITVMLVQTLFIYGVALLVASLVPLLPDIRLLIDNGLLVMFFASGIFFDISERAAHVQEVLYLNPMAVLITAYRDVLLSGTTPQAFGLLWVSALSILMILLGLRLFRRFDCAYPKLIV